MDTPIRDCLNNLVTSPTLEINEKVHRIRSQGKSLYHMGFGEAPFPVHPIIQSAISLSTENNHYLPALGLTDLREKGIAYVTKKHRLPKQNYTAIIGPGSKELIFDFQLSIKGDLLFPVPSWVSYIPQTYITGDNVIKMHTRKEDGYRLTAELLDKSIVEAINTGLNPTKLILNYPNNPTGMTYGAELLKELAEVCRKHGIIVISDEIYALVDYSFEHQSIGAFYPEGSIITTGLSKHLSLGGLRLGIALIPEGLDRLVHVMRSIISETFSSVSSPIQQGVMPAFEESPQLEEYIASCTKIHSKITGHFVSELNKIGLEYPQTQGAFYLYPDFNDFKELLAKKYKISTSKQLASVLLEQFSIASLPGSAFGDKQENLTLRMSTVDFDGKHALELFLNNQEIDNKTFTEKAAPNIAKVPEILAEFLKD